MNVGTNDNTQSQVWLATYVRVLRRLRAAWPTTRFLLGCAPMRDEDARLANVIAAFDDPVKGGTTVLDFGNHSAIERGCYAHPSFAGDEAMSQRLLQAIRQLATHVA